VVSIIIWLLSDGSCVRLGGGPTLTPCRLTGANLTIYYLCFNLISVSLMTRRKWARQYAFMGSPGRNAPGIPGYSCRDNPFLRVGIRHRCRHPNRYTRTLSLKLCSSTHQQQLHAFDICDGFEQFAFEPSESFVEGAFAGRHGFHRLNSTTGLDIDFLPASSNTQAKEPNFGDPSNGIPEGWRNLTLGAKMIHLYALEQYLWNHCVDESIGRSITTTAPFKDSP